MMMTLMITTSKRVLMTLFEEGDLVQLQVIGGGLLIQKTMVG